MSSHLEDIREKAKQAKADRRKLAEERFANHEPKFSNEFDGVSFIAFVSPKSIGFTRLGDATVTLTVHNAMRNEVLKLLDAHSVPLLFTAEKWMVEAEDEDYEDVPN